jgi:hypothetical protein
MSREISAVVLGLIMMLVFMFVSLSVVYLLLNPVGLYFISAATEGLFATIGSMALALLAAIAGGWVCAAIAGQAGTPKVLAMAVLVLGLLLAARVLTSGGEGMEREQGATILPILNVLTQGWQQSWIVLLSPFIGATGVLAGARLKGS